MVQRNLQPPMSKKTETAKERQVRSIFDRKKVSIDYSSTPSRTKSEFKDECDINNVVARALRTGTLPVVDREALYADFTQVSDYATASNVLAQATQAFEQLPSSIKEQFENDVTKLLNFVDDPANEAEAIKLGLLPEQIIESTQTETIASQEAISESNQNEVSNKVDS